MMNLAVRLRRMLVCGVSGLAGGGMLFAAGCDVSRLQALADGLTEVARTLDSGNNNNDISFGDWLLNELDH